MNRYSIIIMAMLFTAACSSKKEAATEDKEAVLADQVQLTDVQLKNAGIETGKAIRQPLNTVLKVDLEPIG